VCRSCCSATGISRDFQLLKPGTDSPDALLLPHIAPHLNYTQKHEQQLADTLKILPLPGRRATARSRCAGDRAADSGSQIIRQCDPRASGRAWRGQGPAIFATERPLSPAAR
jgi:hypothetical protein